jgi:hypothetical protein
MGGFNDWVETIAESGSALEYRKKVSGAETVSMWQSLSVGANYKAAYCLSVCPAGEEVIAPFNLPETIPGRCSETAAKQATETQCQSAHPATNSRSPASFARFDSLV